MDANGNGVIEPNEVPEERRGMLRYLASRMGLDPEKPIPLDQVRERMSGRDRDRDRDEGGGSGKTADVAKPLVPGFGEEQELARVAAFGERVEYASLPMSAAQSASGSALSKVDPERASRIRGFADSMFARYDRNQNGVLDKEEWESSRFAQGADRNNDGKVTKDELTARMAEFSGRRSEESDRGSSDSNESGESGSRKSNGRRSYRFSKATESLPDGLPDWFARNDVNGDGQVAMVEYSSSWSDAKVREFLRYDLNRDGMITPRECLDAPPASDVLADVGGKSTGGDGAPSGPTGASSGTPQKQEEGGAKPWWLE